MGSHHGFFLGIPFVLFVFLGFMLFPAEAAIKKYKFDIQVKSVSRLCHAKPIVTVNGRFPGPTIYVREGDRVIVNVTNHAQYNMSIHWHGLKQYRNGWADGPAYITQCPIQTGNSYSYDFNVTGQRGTLWWHAHILWLRATVYGAVVILPKQGTPFPFPQPHIEEIILLGEWWHTDVEEVEKQGIKTGLPPNMSDAHTINGKPGPLFPCSEKHTFAMEVEQGKTYLLRIINAALNDELFFAIAGHNLTVVEVDAVYTKPFSTQAIIIAPGQTTNVLVQANQMPSRYFMATRSFMDVPLPIDNKTATAILQYKGIPNTILPTLPQLPAPNDTSFVLHYNNKLRSLNSPEFPADIPLKIDRKLLYTIGFGKDSCPTCVNGTRLLATLNNISFSMPQMALLQAHYSSIKGVFKTDFPDKPPKPFNYTGAPLTANLGTSHGTRLSKIKFNSTVELVLQDTNLLTVESHPFHLHGYNFFVVGTGIGNFDPAKDPAKYNLIDPIERNTVGVPTGGWTAIRFRADNPGVWFMHCHLELHTGWGLKTAFVVEDGAGPNQSILPPPNDLPPC
ncbi:Cu-oxidase domain-containing protein/Cu-oxidase_2 domain-containing protein/Cu-oxidase_3 domain-containing protein [Cephalotus follicularis]|uniref:Laccase n=1 Tax=Cephalotus follicularis TaxID=3775 RepID=A0A1Q3AWA1_CEPFO|nr:Cu-oxidase domain-containing protein/Cu-oxidase_2 domain-containing protein/Cu-oxidase_3 domain-containing protein [Cephalotus follicularis]